MTKGRPKQVEIQGQRALWFEPLPAYIVKRGQHFSLMWSGQDYCGLSAKSGDPLFLEAVENFFREKGHTLDYPTQEMHLWLAPEKFSLPDNWQRFRENSTDVVLERKKFYGFFDTGGVCGAHAGYDTREAAIADMGEGPVGTKPEELGQHWVTVLSAEEYVRHVHGLNIEGEGAHFYGEFVA